jgi:hypothetical protein
MAWTMEEELGYDQLVNSQTNTEKRAHTESERKRTVEKWNRKTGSAYINGMKKLEFSDSKKKNVIAMTLAVSRFMSEYKNFLPPM